MGAGSAAGAAAAPRGPELLQAVLGMGGGARRATARRAVEVVEHVLTGDAATDTGTGDVGRIDAVLLHETAHDRRQEPVVLGAAAAPGRPGGRLGGGAGWAGAGCSPRAPERVPARPVPGLVRRPGAGAGAGSWSWRGRRRLGRRSRRGGGVLGRLGCRRREQGRGRGAVSGADDADDRTDGHGVALAGPDLPVSVPATGDGTSVSTLSVDTSNYNGSSAATVLPMFLNQRAIVLLGDGLTEVGAT